MGGFLALDMAASHPSISSVHIVAGGYYRLIRIVNQPVKGFFMHPVISIFYYINTLISYSPQLTRAINLFFKVDL